ncbi:MAG: GTP cyclohydrolase I FolE [Planctomycetota bacterium]|jgi:GTP cyclohydrolase I
MIAESCLAPATAQQTGRSEEAFTDRPAFDGARIERAVREILLAIGEDPSRDGLRETPRRVAKAYAELFAGLREDPAEHLGRVFEHKGDEVVLVGDINLASVCEHHLLPVLGRAHIAYLPSGGRVVGLSKLARTVQVFARRPQLQERLTGQIADALVTHLQPEGVMVVVEAEHLCMTMRGAKSSDSRMSTMARRGVLRSDASLSADVLSMINSLHAVKR